MATLRKPLQGVINIIRFNWHFYVLALAVIAGLVVAGCYITPPLQLVFYIASVLVAAPMVVSLSVSLYVYDLSGLYSLPWIVPQGYEKLVVNINAGFDETSELLQERFTKAQLVVLDFYDPALHTEVSIKRARKAYPPFAGTQSISTHHLPVADNSADVIFLIFAAHEIRNEAERVQFFKEAARALAPGGRIYVTEHLRDLPNFLAYNIGFFHFYARRSWHTVFAQAGLHVQQVLSFTPFVTTFILTKHGHTS